MPDSFNTVAARLARIASAMPRLDPMRRTGGIRFEWTVPKSLVPPVKLLGEGNTTVKPRGDVKLAHPRACGDLSMVAGCKIPAGPRVACAGMTLGTI